MIKFLAIDPGKRNGIAAYNEYGLMQWMRTVLYDELTNFLRKQEEVKVVILEDYTVFPHKAKQHIYSDLITPRAIGKVEGWCEARNIKLVKQGSSYKAMGYKYLGKKPLPKSNPMNHAVDAHAHGIYYLVNNNIVSAGSLLSD